MVLPEKFAERMEKMLGGEYEAFLKSYGEGREYGLRVNTMKISTEAFEGCAPFQTERIPWVSNGYYYGEEDRPAQDPYYAAGLYYLQEPSAMTPASRLPVQPGERVLDLCAAPGGKATELAARLRGSGTLVANDISQSRARALLYNLELFGTRNALVTNETPGKLREAFRGWFDKILVDAPCSGEGMFRKAPEVAAVWEEDRPAYFAKLQRDIVDNAADMLRPGGMMLYSTCTFAPEENEGTVAWLLREHPELHLTDMEGYRGFSRGVPQWGDGSPELEKCVRIWPHKMRGEGHFLALFVKDGTETQVSGERSGQMVQKAGSPKEGRRERLLQAAKMGREERRLLEEFLTDTGIALDLARAEVRGQKAYLLPELPEGVRKLRFLRSGLYLGEFKKNRFEPSQSFAMALDAEACRESISLTRTDERTARYLKGETIEVPDTGKKNGWKLICVDDHALGWGKLLGSVVKNKYLPSWRK